MHLVRDVMDKLLVDRRRDPMGMADGMILELRGDGQPPRVVAIECGFPVLARRIHPPLEQIVRAIGLRLGVRRGKTYRIPWKRVKSIGIEIELELNADETPAHAWENYLRNRVIRHIPGSGA